MDSIWGIMKENERIVGAAAVTVNNMVLSIIIATEGGAPLRKTLIKISNRNIPVVIISKTLLVGDAYYDLLGDYMVSYILLPLKILYDRGFLRKTVVDTRRRIIDDEVSILASYGKILSYALIPIEYFPLKALSVRARLYSTIYSIVMELVNRNGVEAIRRILRETYRDVINFIIEKNRLVKVDEEYVRLSKRVLLEPGYKKYIPRIKEKITPIAMSITSFLIDERSPSTGQRELPLELAKPHVLIKMKEGILGLGDWRELVEQRYGSLRREEKLSIVYATEIFRVNGYRVVVKQYTSPSSIKWVLASIASILSKKFIVNSWERQYNEYHASILLSTKGFPHRRVLVVDPISAVTVFEYIEGKTIIDLAKNKHTLSKEAYRLTGELLARLHLNGIVMGDTKPDNYILTILQGTPVIVPIDLEQVRETNSIEEKAWDIAMFVYFHGMGYSRIPHHYVELIKTFLEEYKHIMGDDTIIIEASRLRYQVPFMYIVPVHNLIQLNNILKNVSS